MSVMVSGADSYEWGIALTPVMPVVNVRDDEDMMKRTARAESNVGTSAYRARYRCP